MGYSPIIGRFLQRDPIPSVNLYEYVGGNPICFVDPDGTTPAFGIWSGINSYGSNYIKPWNLQFDALDQLSGISDLTLFTTGPAPFAQWNFSREAQAYPDPLPDFSSFCPVKIEILMIEPATAAGSPADKCNCCHVHATLLFNPYDNALHIAGFANDLPHRQAQMQGWGSAIPVAIPGSGLVGHTPPKHKPPQSISPFPKLKRVVTKTPGRASQTNTNVTYQTIPNNSFDPTGNDWLTSNEVQNSDFAFVCHSEGCNMLLVAIQKSCKKK